MSERLGHIDDEDGGIEKRLASFRDQRPSGFAEFVDQREGNGVTGGHAVTGFEQYVAGQDHADNQEATRKAFYDPQGNDDGVPIQETFDSDIETERSPSPHGWGRTESGFTQMSSLTIRGAISKLEETYAGDLPKNWLLDPDYRQWMANTAAHIYPEIPAEDALVEVERMATKHYH